MSGLERGTWTAQRGLPSIISAWKFLNTESRRSVSSPTPVSKRFAISRVILPIRRSHLRFEKEDLGAAASELERLGHAVRSGTESEAAARYVKGFIAFREPSGNSIEIVYRPTHSGKRYCGSRDAGITGFSHVGLCSSDVTRDEQFWTQVCNARVSDRIGDAPLLRIDEVHHSIALFPSDAIGIQHINHQVESGDDVMRSYYFLKERGVPITFGPGRHPTSSARFLYFKGPDGMVFEYSSGVRSIADELLYRERQFSFDHTGFCHWGATPQIRQFEK